ncbi:uncharacterized protein [Dysidea avara]|uniref:uncharacterized protein n=1 Tax=Dysidea avara TaxID=196820 RepID=UPI00332048A2
MFVLAALIGIKFCFAERVRHNRDQLRKDDSVQTTTEESEQSDYEDVRDQPREVDHEQANDYYDSYGEDDSLSVNIQEDGSSNILQFPIPVEFEVASDSRSINNSACNIPPISGLSPQDSGSIYQPGEMSYVMEKEQFIIQQGN